MTTSLTVSAEVIDRVGLQEAAEFQAQVTTFECVECGTAGDVRTGPAVVVLRASPGLSHLGVAHHRCADSQVREYEQGALVPADAVDLIPRAIGLPGQHGIKPALLLAYEEGITVVDGEGGAYDPMVKQLLAEGLHQLPALGKTAPLSPGWQVRLGPGTAVSVASSATTHLDAGEVYAPPAWKQLVAPTGLVTLLVGRLRREVIYADQPPYADYAKALVRGHMVGGLVAVR